MNIEFITVKASKNPKSDPKQPGHNSSLISSFTLFSFIVHANSYGQLFPTTQPVPAYFHY